MKRLALLAILAYFGCRTADTPEKLFKIPSYTGNEKIALMDTVQHKPGDAAIFRVLGLDTTYYIRMYRTDNGELRLYEATITDNILYDKVSYKWLNDSTVSFHLLDSKNNKWNRFQLTGSGPTTSLREDE